MWNKSATFAGKTANFQQLNPMCKKYVYLRVSTDKQCFDQQKQDIIAFGVNLDEVDDIVEEHESGGTSYTDRKFQELLNRCNRGDIIYAGSTDRLGRSFSDMIRLMADAKERGVSIIACKQGLKLDDDSLATKLLLSIMTIIDEDERQRIRHRILNSNAAKRREIAEHGFYTVRTGPNAGMRRTTLGGGFRGNRELGLKAAGIARSKLLDEWRQNSIAYQWVLEKVTEGWRRSDIIREFNYLHKMQPEVFCTRKGAPMSKGVLSKWISSAGLTDKAFAIDRKKLNNNPF